MRCFHTTRYDLYNKNNIKIMIMSDIHFSKCVKDKKLNYITKYINKEQPNYILIPGDLIDSNNDIEVLNEKDRLINWLKEISKNTITLISLGNHDIFRRINGKRVYFKNEELINEIDNINNIYVLDNTNYEDDNIYVSGITQNYKYFEHENIEILLDDLEKNNLIIHPNNDKLKILLIHSPSNLDKQIIMEKLIDFDYIICGHMHNRCVPPMLSEIWRSTRGIITPTKKFFKKYERNTLKHKDDKILVNGPVTTFQHVSGFFKVFNFLFPTYISIMNFNKKNEFKIIKKYHKYK